MQEANRLKNRRLNASKELKAPSETAESLKQTEKSKKEKLDPAEEKQMLRDLITVKTDDMVTAGKNKK